MTVELTNTVKRCAVITGEDFTVLSDRNISAVVVNLSNQIHEAWPAIGPSTKITIIETPVCPAYIDHFGTRYPMRRFSGGETALIGKWSLRASVWACYVPDGGLYLWNRQAIP